MNDLLDKLNLNVRAVDCWRIGQYKEGTDRMIKAKLSSHSDVVNIINAVRNTDDKKTFFNGVIIQRDFTYMQRQNHRRNYIFKQNLSQNENEVNYTKKLNL